jgi:hypothetical protein
MRILIGLILLFGQGLIGMPSVDSEQYQHRSYKKSPICYTGYQFCNESDGIRVLPALILWVIMTVFLNPTIMKRIVLLLLVSVIPVNILCQQEVEMRLDSVVGADEEESGKWYYSYDENGDLLYEHFYRSGGKILTETSFNKIGKKSESISYILISGEYVFDVDTTHADGFCPCRIVYHYDEAGALSMRQEFPNIHPDSGCILCNYFIPWGGSMECGVGSSLYDNYYDSLGNLTGRTSYGYEHVFSDGSDIIDSTFSGSDSVVYLYDTLNYLSEEIHYISMDRRPYRRSVFVNDTMGNVLEECQYVWSGGWQGDCNTSVYTFDSLGNIIKKVKTGWSDGLSADITIRTEYVYNEHGYIIEKNTYEQVNCPGCIPLTFGKKYYWSFPPDTGLVNIPDAAFLHALIKAGADTNGDSLISFAEAAMVSILNVGVGGCDDEVTDITGIEAFVNLETLYMTGAFTQMDFSGNNRLKTLNIGNCYCAGYREPETLDLSSNTELENLSCWGQSLTHLNVSNNTKLTFLDCACNSLSSLDLSNNLLLRELNCRENSLIRLDISNCPNLEIIDVEANEELTEVCVWESPFPPEGVTVWTEDNPHIYFTTECSEYMAPEIITLDTLYQPDFIEATSSENGMIYLVPPETEKDIMVIRKVCIDSVEAITHTPVSISLSGIGNGVYWLYASNSTGNLSEPEAFNVLGVGMEPRHSENLRIYPNPTFKLLTIETVASDRINIEIASLDGQIMYQKEMEGTTHQLDLSSFQKGAYFITIMSKDFTISRMIVKL